MWAIVGEGEAAALAEGVRRVVRPVDGRLLGTRLARSGQLHVAGGDGGRVCVAASRSSPGMVGRVNHLHRVTFHTTKKNANFSVSVSRCSAVRGPCGRLVM